MTAASLFQVGSMVCLNGAFAVTVGALCARRWLSDLSSWPGLPALAGALQRIQVFSAFVAMVAAGLSLWSATAVMMDGSLGEALPMVLTMARDTSYGRSGVVGVLALAAAALIPLGLRLRSGTDGVVAVFLLIFAACRASVSHAGEEGLLTLAVGIEWLHLVAVSVWVGGVAIGGWAVLPAVRLQATAPQLATYLDRLSTAATAALAAIVATGLYNAWQRVGTVARLDGDPYGDALLVKVALVSIAAAMGAYNKLWGFPRLGRAGIGLVSTVAILRVESLVLMGALGAAATLMTLQPPTAH